MSALYLPDPDDFNGVLDFALSFDGYAHFGSVRACAAAARAQRRESFDDLRNELFFAVRAAHHQGNSSFMDVYEELYPLMAMFADRQPDK